FFFFQAEDGIRDFHVTGVQTCALPIYELTSLGSLQEALRICELRLQELLVLVARSSFRKRPGQSLDAVRGRSRAHDDRAELRQRSEERRVGKGRRPRRVQER